MRHLNHKLLLTALISMLCATSFAHDIAVANTDGVTIYYNFTNNNTELEVTFQGNSISDYYNEYSGNVVIPKTVTYNGKTYNVTTIGASAFQNCSELTSVTIPNSVTSIGQRAFDGCFTLTSVTIPNSVTSIGQYAFQNCWDLTSVTIPNSVTSIGDYAFYGCSDLTSVTIPNSVTDIGYSAFENCSKLTSVTIPNSVTYLGARAFGSCASLTSITISNSLTSIGERAFAQCSSLTSVTIPNSVTSIGTYAFDGCSALASITIPNSVTSVGAHAFDGTPWYNNQPDGLIYVGKVAYKYKGTMPENTSIIIQDGTTEISNSAFIGCHGMTSISIPNSVTSIGERAFENCSGLTSVTIPNSLTTINMDVFKKCTSLTSVTIPNSVTRIVEGAFNGCSGLISVTIPNSVTSIERDTFIDCSSLTSVTIPNSVTSIDGYAFSGCSSLTSITIPNSVTTINTFAFRNCSSLTSVTIPNSVTSIGNRAFMGCSSLTSVTIGNSVTSIGQYAFNGCSSLTSVIIPNSVTTIGERTFYNCSSLTNVTIPNSVTSIGSAAFYNCSNLTAVKVGMENPVSITSGTFSNRKNAILYVPRGSKDAYKAASYWKQFKEIVEYDPEIILDETSVDDPASYPVTMDVKVLRTIKGGEWNTICLPFAMTGEQVSAAFGSVELADFSDYQVGKSGEKTISIMINFTPVSAADGMEANHPYLIRTADDIDEFTVSEVMLVPDEENAQKVFSVTEDGQTVSKGYMKGTYHAQTIVPADNLFVSANKFYYSTGKTKMMAYRAYFYLADRLDRNESASAKISFMFNESSTDGIEDVKVRTAASSAIFDIQGRKVADSADGLQGLPKGIYIINGKKVVR